MKIGAGDLVKAWGQKMNLKRNGSTIINQFYGRLVDPRGSQMEAELWEFDNSVSQEFLVLIAAADEFGTVRPQKFDVVTLVGSGREYTVQRARTAGADEEELVKMLVAGGRV